MTAPLFVSEMEFIPQQSQVVHHAIGFLVAGQDRAAIAELEGADGQGGWTCFGFSPGRSAELVVTWAPGTDPTVFPEGTGLETEPGDFFVMHTHLRDPDLEPAYVLWADGTDDEMCFSTIVTRPI